MSPARYAEGTSVPAQKTRLEIEMLVAKHGAKRFASGFDDTKAVISFSLANRMVRFTVPLPTEAEVKKGRTARSKADLRDQLARERWRALLLAIKSKLVAVETGVESFEQAFLAHVVMPNGRTVGEEMAPIVAQAYLSGGMPALPSGLPEGRS